MFRCCNLRENEYGKEVCRFTGTPCNCNSRQECNFSDCFDHEVGEWD